MNKIFYLFNDVMTYFDNIILYTKNSFNHHCKRIQAVLQEIRNNNMHVHIEKPTLLPHPLIAWDTISIRPAYHHMLRKSRPS
eukprot:4636562-Ditylum_brightwellii.AAC.1